MQSCTAAAALPPPRLKACCLPCLPLPALGADKFAEIVKLRNKLAGVAGYQNYYDMKLQQAEGFTLQVGACGRAVGLWRGCRGVVEGVPWGCGGGAGRRDSESTSWPAGSV
jgi:hypothetical protein